MEQLDPVTLFTLSFSTSAFAGLFAAFRSTDQLTIRNLVSAAGNAGMLGLALALFGQSYYRTFEGTLAMIAMSIMLGLGGPKVIDSIIAVTTDAIRRALRAIIEGRTGKKDP